LLIVLQCHTSRFHHGSTERYYTPYACAPYKWKKKVRILKSSQLIVLHRSLMSTISRCMQQIYMIFQYLEIDDEDRLRSKLYNKRYEFHISIVCSSSISTATIYWVYAIFHGLFIITEFSV
jgi:hypothetical protein